MPWAFSCAYRRSIEAFIACFEQAAKVDLSQFQTWYNQAGTPELVCQVTHNAKTKTVDLTVERLATLGGADPPLSIHVNAQRARKLLEQIKSRTMTIPGLAYAKPVKPTSASHVLRGEVAKF